MGKIIALHSFRGGSGKTNIISNLATLCIKTGKKVGIIDGDLQSPGITKLFAINNIENTLFDYLQGNCAIQEAVYEVIKRKLFLIPTSLIPIDIVTLLRQGIDIETLTQGIYDVLIKLKLDYLFIDTHSGLSEETLAALSIADQLFILIKPGDQDDQGTVSAIEILKKLKIPHMGILINKVPKEIDLEDLKYKVTKAYQIPVEGIFPFSYEIFHLKSFEIFTSKYPNHSMTKALKTMARKLNKSLIL